MFTALSDRGILFNCLTGFFRVSTKDIKSGSDAFVKLMRMLKKDPNITHDQQMFRDYRNGDPEKLIRELKAVCRLTGFDLDSYLSEVEGYELRHLGAWFGMKVAVASFRKAHHEYGRFELDEFFSFLLAHCEIEYLCLKGTDEKNYHEVIQKFVRDWLLIDRLQLPELPNEQVTEYVIKLVMYWAALFDLMMELSHQPSPTLSNYLPELAEKQGKTFVVPSIEVFLERLKNNWAKDKYQKDRITWTQLYRDILAAQCTDESYCRYRQEAFLNEKELKLWMVDPDTNAIKARFKRLKEGGLLSADEFKSDIAILYVPFSEADSLVDEISLVRFINIFTYVQRELCHSGRDAEEIVRYFSEYPVYRNLVKDRFERFRQSGELTC
ncbi:hypothetical protein CDB79_RS22195 [Vibrio parahaemolyticus]|nr:MULTISPECIES: hypothetical protein [Vibrio harveyi group]HBK7246602.1 hypothetical protein [Vibrio cholerae]ANQ19625.1 hypothetical protein BA891_20920 [Vibrio natriegens]EJG1709721.1 hypothetical protein [Vibrio parahaemolyticus]EJG1744678.1 hypothetical protein [Vibrio parahaemolyticus]EJG1778686.1 hypothetical protein [Vibrio parahaemolyticus]